MDTENGVLELWSNGGTGDDVSESLSNGSRQHRGEEARGKGEKRGIGGRLEACFGEICLCSITHFYTFLHVFTRIYTMFLNNVNVTN
jgi:hypothetical protein